MIVINKLTKPGGIRRIDILPGTVCIRTSDGQELLYRECAGEVEVGNCHKEKSDGRI